MKRNLYILMFIAFAFVACKKNKKEKQYWKASIETIEGEYEGKIPCSDCDGQFVRLKLNMDLSALKTVSFINSEKGAEAKLGKWSLNEQTHLISITFGSGKNLEYYTAEANKLIFVNSQSQPIQTNESETLTLTKIDD